MGQQSVANGAIVNGTIVNGAIVNGAIVNGAIVNGAMARAMRRGRICLDYFVICVGSEHQPADGRHCNTLHTANTFNQISWQRDPQLASSWQRDSQLASSWP